MEKIINMEKELTEMTLEEPEDIIADLDQALRKIGL